MKTIEADKNSDDQVKLLNKILQKLKEEKIKSEKNEILFKKRYKVLSMDKNLWNLKRANELKSLEKKKYIRTCISQDKDKLIKKKINDEQKLEEQKVKNFVLKYNINKSLEWRKKNFSGLIKQQSDKIKQEKKLRINTLNEIKMKNLMEKKLIHDEAKINSLRLKEQKRNQKILKNIGLKTELKRQIDIEIEALAKLNPYTKNEEEINKILKMYPNLNEINSNEGKNI